MSNSKLAKHGVIIIPSKLSESDYKNEIIVDGSMTNGVFSIVEQILPIGKLSDKHSHTKEGHGVYIIKGIVEAYVMGVFMTLKEGDYIYVPKNVWHEFRIIEDFTKIRITIFPAGFESLFMELSNQPIENHDKIIRRYGVTIDNSTREFK